MVMFDGKFYDQASPRLQIIALNSSIQTIVNKMRNDSQVAHLCALHRSWKELDKYIEIFEADMKKILNYQNEIDHILHNFPNLEEWPKEAVEIEEKPKIWCFNGKFFKEEPKTIH